MRPDRKEMASRPGGAGAEGAVTVALMAKTVAPEVAVSSVRAQAYTVPTEAPESDGTLERRATTVVVVEARAGGECGLGHTYTDAAGEHGYDLAYVRRTLEAGAVDVLQADATRCAGVTGFLRVGGRLAPDLDRPGLGLELRRADAAPYAV